MTNRKCTAWCAHVCARVEGQVYIERLLLHPPSWRTASVSPSSVSPQSRSLKRDTESRRLNGFHALDPCISCFWLLPAGAADMNCFPVSLVVTSLSVSFLTGALSFSIITNLKSLPEASSVLGLLGLTVRKTQTPTRLLTRLRSLTMGSISKMEVVFVLR